jgi:cyclopropane fatty-acyl-phospholipid synthase-like methyltransferase
VDLFARRAEAATRAETPSIRAGREAFSDGGSVLDVGCGAGAASLPLAERARQITGVDTSAEMLEAFTAGVTAAGVDAVAIEGQWPEVADRTPPADVVVCHHVFYNVADLPEFARRLSDHAIGRVVVELTQAHPRKSRDPLWLRFHELRRPEGPTANDAVAVLREAGIEPQRLDWVPSTGTGFATLDALVANLRKELCLTEDRDPEIAGAVADWVGEGDGTFRLPPSPSTTLWWEGRAT